jgi:MATE family multidrug resistance protein
MVPLGLGTAATVSVGLANGARNNTGITRDGWSAYGIAVVYACCTAIVMLLFGRQLVGVFLDLHNPMNTIVADLAVSYLVLAGLFQLVDAAQGVGSGMLRGLGDTRIPMIFAGIGYWGVGLPLGALLGFAAHLGGVGIWIGLSAGLAVVAVLMTTRWIMRDRLGLTTRPAPDQGSAAAAAH